MLSLRRFFHRNSFNTHRWFSSAVRVYRQKMVESVRVGCASGFWGDTAGAAPQLIHSGSIDYLVFDYLSEITMSLLAATRAKNPALGYCSDFVQTMNEDTLRAIQQHGIKVIANAGGVNPNSCASALIKTITDARLNLTVAVVNGDDILAEADSMRSSNVVEMFSGKPLPKNLTSMNVYLGARPIVAALHQGADIIVTGRCVDSALVLGPLIHELGWRWTDYDHLAAGSVAGHIIECGAQATGGNFTDWDNVSGWENIGFPIVEMRRNGDFTVSKPPGTGGKLSVGTVAEQLLYEIGDPRCYLLPDVSCDVSRVTLRSDDCNDDTLVHVTNVRGSAPTNTHKASATYLSGYRTTTLVPIFGPLAAQKAMRTAEAIIKRVRRLLSDHGMDDFTDVEIRALGTGASFSGVPSSHDTQECVLWLSATHATKDALEILGREIAPASTCMAPGMTCLPGGRPRPTPVFKLFSCLIPKAHTTATISLQRPGDEALSFPHDVSENNDSDSNLLPPPDVTPLADKPPIHADIRDDNFITVTIGQLAFTRSGDKGNNCNVGIIARRPEFTLYIQRALTNDALTTHFKHLFDDTSSHIDVYELPGCNGFNVVMQRVLGGGGISSLRPDPQGKAYGQLMLTLPVQVPEHIL